MQSNPHGFSVSEVMDLPVGREHTFPTQPAIATSSCRPLMAGFQEGGSDKCHSVVMSLSPSETKSLKL
jgi:hypothetical protein